MAASLISQAAAERDVLADWLPYLVTVRECAVSDPACSITDLNAVTVEEIDKLLRRSCITPREASCLLRALDATSADHTSDR